MGRWLMAPTGFEPVKGKHFTYQTTPAGAWDGTIHCEVLEVMPNERFAYAWKGGHEANVGYGARLDTVVTLHPLQGQKRHAPSLIFLKAVSFFGRTKPEWTRRRRVPFSTLERMNVTTVSSREPYPTLPSCPPFQA